MKNILNVTGTVVAAAGFCAVWIGWRCHRLPFCVLLEHSGLLLPV